MILIDFEDAYNYVVAAFKYYKNNPTTDTFGLQHIGYVGVNFLNYCYHQKAAPKYWQFAIDFLKKELPPDPSIGIEKVIADYYQAKLNNDKAQEDVLIKVLKSSGYYGIIQDTVE